MPHGHLSSTCEALGPREAHHQGAVQQRATIDQGCQRGCAGWRQSASHQLAQGGICNDSRRSVWLMGATVRGSTAPESPDAGPEMRTTATAHRVDPELRAKMVSLAAAVPTISAAVLQQ